MRRPSILLTLTTWSVTLLATACAAEPKQEDEQAARVATLETENAALREQLAALQATSDRQQKQIVDLTDALHQARDARRKLEEQQAELVSKISRWQKVLRGGPDAEPDQLQRLPPMLVGQILAIRKGHVEISLGSDDGLQEGHQFDVKHVGYRGRIVIRRIDPDRAVGEIITAADELPIQKGDRVIPYWDSERYEE